MSFIPGQPVFVDSLRVIFVRDLGDGRSIVRVGEDTRIVATVTLTDLEQ